jgi:hypothetical protein
MGVQISTDSERNILLVRATDKLSQQDYEQLMPAVEELIQQRGKVRVLFEMDDFHGWSAGALWEDIKFDAAHFNDIERVALVGDAKWEAWMATFCRPFTSAQIRFFDRAQVEEAQRWIADRQQDQR